MTWGSSIHSSTSHKLEKKNTLRKERDDKIQMQAEERVTHEFRHVDKSLRKNSLKKSEGTFVAFWGQFLLLCALARVSLTKNSDTAGDTRRQHRTLTHDVGRCWSSCGRSRKARQGSRRKPQTSIVDKHPAQRCEPGQQTAATTPRELS